MDEQVKIMLKRAFDHINDEHSHFDQLRCAGIIEGILIAVGCIGLNDVFEYREIEVDNPNILGFSLFTFGVKTIIRKETYVEYMRRRALEYIKMNESTIIENA